MCQRFHHENLIKLVDHVINERNQIEALLLFPYYQNGSLQNLIDHHGNQQPMEEEYIMQLFRGVCEAIKVMHTSHDPIAHRDITPTNLLLSNDKQGLILVDLGSATVARTTISTRQEAIAIQEHCAQTCTAPYRAPELFEIPYTPYSVTEVTDIWSLGCCLFTTAFGICPFDGSALAAVSGRVSFPQQHGYSDQLCSLISHMLTVDSSSRINISQVVVAMHTRISTQ